MRRLFILLFLANLVLTMIMSFLLPAYTPIDLSGGMISGGSSADLGTLIYIFMEVLMFGIIYFAPRLMFSLPPRWYNLPNTDYWLREENKPRALSIISSMMWQFGAVVFLFLLVVHVLSITAHLSGPAPADETKFVLVFVLFLLYVIVWCIKFFRAFQVPRA